MKILSKNKKAFHDYEVIEKIVAGIVLTGPEIKATRSGLINLKGSYIALKNGEAWTQNMHIGLYKYANLTDYDPLRPRKLLLSKKEIGKLTSQEAQKGITIVPLDVHLSKNFAKMTIGICKGKKLHDKRADLKKKAQQKDIDQALKHY